MVENYLWSIRNDKKKYVEILFDIAFLKFFFMFFSGYLSYLSNG